MIPAQRWKIIFHDHRIGRTMCVFVPSRNEAIARALHECSGELEPVAALGAWGRLPVTDDDHDDFDYTDDHQSIEIELDAPGNPRPDPDPLPAPESALWCACVGSLEAPDPFPTRTAAANWLKEHTPAAALDAINQRLTDWLGRRPDDFFHWSEDGIFEIYQHKPE